MPIPCCDDGVTPTSPNDPGDNCRPIDVSGDPLSTAQGKICMRFVRSLVASRGCLVGTWRKEGGGGGGGGGRED